MNKSAPVILLVTMVMCACHQVPPAAPVPHAEMPVSASFGKTWDAVIDVFAQKTIPIRTLERVSGLIAAEPASVQLFALRQPHPWVDCGSIADVPVQPASAFYNVRVKGDSLKSSVLVTVLWKTAASKDNSATDCSTKGVWETDVESDIKARAEGAESITPAPPAVVRAPPPSPQKAKPATARVNAMPLEKKPAPTADALIERGSSATIGAPSSEADRAEAAEAFADAKSFVGTHEWAKAEQTFQKAILFDGSVAKYHAGMGDLMMLLHRWEDAEASYSAALLLNVDNPDYRQKLKEARARR